MPRSPELHIAAGSNNTSALDAVLRLPPKDQHALMTGQDGGHNTPMHIACYKGHLEFVVKTLKSPAYSLGATNLSDLVNDNGNTPLHLAVLGSHLTVVHALLTASPPASFHLKDKQGYTPMHYACGEGFLDIVQVVLRCFLR
jgi:ankyrin repeat protein